jgi:hypothetical protein
LDVEAVDTNEGQIADRLFKVSNLFFTLYLPIDHYLEPFLVLLERSAFAGLLRFDMQQFVDPELTDCLSCSVQQTS